MTSDEVRSVYLGEDIEVSMSLLDIDGLDAGYGDFQALFGIELHVDEAETVSMIGANGAGKSTLLKAIAGMRRADGGRRSATPASRSPALPANRRVADGISLVPEGRRIFPSFTVEENLLVGAHCRPQGSVDETASDRRVPAARQPGAVVQQRGCREASSRRSRSAGR